MYFVKKGVLSLQLSLPDFDAEMKDHVHFKCTECGTITDIFDDNQIPGITNTCTNLLPNGFKMQTIQTTIWGQCNACSQ